MLKIIATKNINGAWYWRIVGGNGETMAHSEAYSSKGACTFQSTPRVRGESPLPQEQGTQEVSDRFPRRQENDVCRLRR